jgi:hypothetical protein
MNKGEKELDITTCSEAELYFDIDALGYAQWRQNHDSTVRRIPTFEAEKKTLTSLLKAAVAQTARFGVATPLNEDGSASKEYWQWYDWWYKWQHGMAEEEWQQVDTALLDPEKRTNIKPPGDWRTERRCRSSD